MHSRSPLSIKACKANSNPHAVLFGATTVHCPLNQPNSGIQYEAQIHCRIDSGHSLEQSTWIFYRRNYFQISASFSVCERMSVDPVLCMGAYSVRGNDNNLYPVKRFYFQLSAHASDTNRPVDLIQLTTKRNKGPQSLPHPISVQPSNGDLGHKPRRVETEAVFERIQFKTATANNNRKKSVQQHYTICVQLMAESSQGSVCIASRQSVPIVVRGRGPGHYSNRHTPTNHPPVPTVTSCIAATNREPSPAPPLPFGPLVLDWHSGAPVHTRSFSANQPSYYGLSDSGDMAGSWQPDIGHYVASDWSLHYRTESTDTLGSTQSSVEYPPYSIQPPVFNPMCLDNQIHDPWALYDPYSATPGQ
ncbi:hypothetical protein CLU79DRAFT_744346 [Phycomyces nitens]|nr:hypothetical protein CLU79DRAFT_744346 [Phycomyces nitens]